jgi:hypothetical protein
VSEPDKVKDVFDGTHYKKLLRTIVTILGEKQGHKFFSDLRDIALGISLDGFAPFKRRKYSSWPIIIFLYNLPPEIRFQLDNIFCIGEIPGSPKDVDSFIYPFVQEMLKAAAGVRAYDFFCDEIFSLHLYPILGFGDIPAIAKLLKMKGHNSECPCRMCSIVGIQAPSAFYSSSPFILLTVDQINSCTFHCRVLPVPRTTIPLISHSVITTL